MDYIFLFKYYSQKVIKNTPKVFLAAAVTLGVMLVFFNMASSGNRLRIPSPKEANKIQHEQLIAYLNELEKNNSNKSSIIVYKVSTCVVFGENCSSDPKAISKNNVVSFLSNLITLPFSNPPASGVYYVQSKLLDAGFIPKTYASAGIGMSALKPFVFLWQVFRDISYAVLILFFIIIGFLIMFRAKINAQTVISIENALPKIILTLILITFSFAISGFLIDMMYVITALVLNVLASNKAIAIDPNQIFNQFVSGNGFDLFSKMYSSVSFINIVDSLLSLLPVTLNICFRLGIAFLSWMLASKIPGVGPLINGSALNDVLGTGGLPGMLIQFATVGLFLVLSSWIVPAMLAMLISITILFVIFRIIFLLIKTYINILLAIIFAPLILLVEAFPGKSSFMSWVKNLSVNLLVFPFIIFLFVFSFILTNTPVADGEVWRPPFLYALNAESFLQLIGMAIIFMIPDLVKMFKEILGVKESPISFSPGLFFGGVTASAGGAMGMLSSYGSIGMALPGLRTGIASRVAKISPTLGRLFEGPPQGGQEKKVKEDNRDGGGI